MIFISTISKFNKKESLKLGGHLLAVQELIRKILSSSIDTMMVAKLLEIKKMFPEIGYEEISFLKVQIAENILKEEELKTTLSYCVSTDGVGKGIKIDEEKINDFYNVLYEKTTEEFLRTTIATYNKKEENINNAIEAARIVNSINDGVEYEVK
ncbi:MAG: hypothetical protein ACRC5T_07670 [Cetobacterium sp.]